MDLDNLPFNWSPETGFDFSQPSSERPDTTPVEAPQAERPSRRAARPQREESQFDGDLKQEDLLEYENLNTIRAYMTDFKGVQYRDMAPEEVVDDFMEHMEQHTYIFKIKDNEEIAQKCRKKFYVSPFMDMETYYNFKLLNPNDKLSVFIKQTDSIGTVLTATQTGERKEFSSKQLMINFLKYPLMTIKIISSIHFEALLLWKKGAIYRRRNTKLKNNLSYEEY